MAEQNSQQKTKNCHFVQQAYLKNFASDSKRRKIFRFDKKTFEIDEKPIKKVAKEDYFYPQWLEEWFQRNTETFGIKIINKIINTGTIETLTDAEKLHLVRWMIVQNERTIERQNAIKQGTQVFFGKMNEKFGNVPDNYEEDFDKKYLLSLQFDQIFRFLNLAPEIIKYRWMLLENSSKIPFYTSDNPIGLFNIYDDVHRIKKMSQKKGTGYLCHGIALNLPLNEKFALRLVNSKNLPLFDLGVKSLGPNVNSNRDNVIYHNCKVVFGSNRYIYSNQSDFSSLKEILDKYPEYKKENRVRYKAY